MSLSRKIPLLAAVAVATLALSSAAQFASAQDFPQDFFRNLFGGGFARQAPPPMTPMSYGGDQQDLQFPPRDAAPPRYSGGGTAYCVRTCDGRYFPVPAGYDRRTKADVCNSFCPASDTKVFYGGSIDNATANGKAYSDLPNAFKYREQLVAGCTCNGKDSVGLASVKIEDDPTLRKGDIVAGPEGLVVANRGGSDRRGAALNFSPAPEKIRAKYSRLAADTSAD